MRVDVYLPLVLSLLLAAVSPQVARRLAPAPAARTLVVSGMVTAVTSVWGLVLLAGTLLGDTPPVAEEAREHRLHIAEPVPEAIAVAAVVALAVAAFRLWRVLRARSTAARALRRLSRAHPEGTELIVAASPAARAFAVPGPPRRILVTTGMLQALDASERRVLLSHERAHLRHRHARISAAVEAAAAVNPLLAPVRDTVDFLLERWADEHAAHVVGDRGTAARALARAALAAHGGHGARGLAFSDRSVTRRVAALRCAPPPNARLAAAAVLVLGAVPAFGAVDATRDFLAVLGHALLLI